MDSSGVMIRQSICPPRCSDEIFSFGSKIQIGVRKRTTMPVGSWSDDSHRLYYASALKCNGVKDAKRTEEKMRPAFATDLSRDLAALYSTRSEGGDGEAIASEFRSNMMTEAAKLLLAQLNHQKSSEKKLMKKKKEEKAALKAAKMRNCVEKPPSSSSSSSSTSSESSDSDCEEVSLVNRPAKNLQKVKLGNINGPDLSSELAQKQSLPKPESIIQTEIYQIKPKLKQDCIISNAAAKLEQTCASSTLAVAEPSDKIEVCMGGKCKKSGAVELLQELKSKVGVEGTVVGCKCMGKCNEGPNVRVATESANKSLCIGVGLEDVKGIVAHFFGESNGDLGFLAV